MIDVLRRFGGIFNQLDNLLPRSLLRSTKGRASSSFTLRLIRSPFRLAGNQRLQETGACSLRRHASVFGAVVRAQKTRTATNCHPLSQLFHFNPFLPTLPLLPIHRLSLLPISIYIGQTRTAHTLTSIAVLWHTLYSLASISTFSSVLYCYRFPASIL